jgi:hypothetical protein
VLMKALQLMYWCSMCLLVCGYVISFFSSFLFLVGLWACDCVFLLVSVSCIWKKCCVLYMVVVKHQCRNTNRPIQLYVNKSDNWWCNFCVPGHYPLSCFYLKHVSKTGFFVLLQVEHTQLCPVDRTSPHPWIPAPGQDGIYLYKPSTA